jgi:fungal STAND N-terminal Goodbye domain
MSLTGQAVSSTSGSGSNSNLRFIFEAALADYARITGIDLSKNRFVAGIGQTDSPEGILLLLQEREHAFKEFRDDNQRLTITLNPAVRVLHALSGILGDAVGTVSHTRHLVNPFF